eukprot:g30453.t1
MLPITYNEHGMGTASPVKEKDTSDAGSEFPEDFEDPSDSDTVHWGQRKLFMAELELLLDFASEAQLLVYAGAAEGQHLAFLCELFPEIEVEAWDPRPFAPSAVPPEAPENLHDLANRDVPILFVSDIRTANWQVDTTEEHDRRLLADLQAQQRWVEVLHPKRALLQSCHDLWEDKSTSRL